MSHQPALLLDVRLERPNFRLDFQLESNARSLVLFGPSGSGKTTLLRAILGLEKSAKSKIVLDGICLDDTDRGVRLPTHERRLGWVPQSPTLFPDRSVLDNIRYGARVSAGTADIDRAIEVLELGSRLNSSTTELSGGERQRVALARAIACRPQALLLDEPLASLDLKLRGRVLPFLIRVREELEMPIIHITHDPDEAILFGDEIAVIDDGHLIAGGDPRETLWSRSVLPLTTQLGVENLLEVEPVEEADSATRVRTDRGLEIEMPWPVDAGTQVRLGVRAEDILISLDAPGRISARNVWSGKIERIESVDEHRMIHVAVNQDKLVAKLTESAVRELDLVPGSTVFLILKSQAIRLV